MKLSQAMVVGFVVAVVGLIGLVAPSIYVSLGWFSAVPPGLYVVAVVQLVIGLILLHAAPTSRSPVGLGVLGAFALVEAVVMPLLGRGTARSMASWWATQSDIALRLWAALELAVGVLIILSVAPPRRRPLRPAGSAA